MVFTADVIIYSKTIEDHVFLVIEILIGLKDAGVTPEINECYFFQHTIEYLHHTIKPA